MRSRRGAADASVTADILDLVPALRGYAWSLTRSQQDVDDLVQETLTKAVANVGRFEPGTHLRAWLMTIMRNSFYNDISKRNRERTGGADCVSGSVVSPATQEWTIRGKEVLEAVLALPEYYREVLVLVVMLGESYESAARICGVTIGTVKSRVNRARSIVMRQLGEEKARSSRSASRRNASSRGTGSADVSDAARP
jgi:RNA polymerase sigma factor (sigma-70 family)